MDVLLLAVFAASNIVCFIIGAKIGQMAAKGEKIEMPNINPVKAMQEYRDKQVEREEQSRIDTIMRNIEKYDGTSRGQEDVPRG